jgi:hypothetical protein
VHGIKETQQAPKQKWPPEEKRAACFSLKFFWKGRDKDYAAQID